MVDSIGKNRAQVGRSSFWAMGKIYALNRPPNLSSAVMTCADQCATSSSRSVRSAD